MAQNRTRPKKATLADVLNEYNHLCAICGAPRPQVHHIDEVHSNNDPLNLLPLCPNHHLVDIHNPTKKPDPLKIALFRQFKDPQILSPQFEPIFQRLRFLLVPFDRDGWALGGLGIELAGFVHGLSMGSYYCSKIMALTAWPQPRPHAEEEKERVLVENDEIYFDQLRRNKRLVLELCVELLRYQSWPVYRGEPWPLLRA